MSEDLNKQAVVETADAPAKPGAEAASARNDGDDLDTLLATYDETTQKPTQPEPQSKAPEQKPGATNELNVLATEVRAGLAEINQVKYRQDMDSTIKAVRGDLDSEVFDDSLIEGWLNAQAQHDPRLSKAWLDRSANPKQFEKVVKGLSKSFSQKFSKLPDRQATEDREVVAAAVRGTSTKAPEGKAPNYGKQTNNEFADNVEKEFGFRPL